MPRKFEELLEDMRQAEIDESFVAELEGAWSASPLRRERDEAKSAAQAALERAQKAEQVALEARFADLGIKAAPSAFRLPDDFDVTDPAKVRAWAESVNLIEAASNDDQTTAEERKAHEQAAAAGIGAAPPPTGAGAQIENVLAQLDPNLPEKEFWARAQALGVTNL